MYKKIRLIVRFIVLAAFFLVLPVSCDFINSLGGNSDTPGGGDSGPVVEVCNVSESGVGDTPNPNGDLDGDGVMNSADVDDDNDGLIDIHNLDMFDNIRCNLAGTSYGVDKVTTGGPTVATDNCPTPTNGVYLCGYELMEDLDFAQVASYALGSVNYRDQTWRPVDVATPISSLTPVAPDSAVNAGFPGIGAARSTTGGFNAIFEGNDHTINNFYSRNTSCSGTFIKRCNTGLFRLTNSAARIRNLDVRIANVYGGTGSWNHVGSLVGRNFGTITKSSASGSADGSGGGGIGSLVGLNGGTITESFAAGMVKGGYAGGLVGWNTGAGTIIASYATGNVEATNTGGTTLGGLVGLNSGIIIAGSASGSVVGGSENDSLGGLVGGNSGGGTIIASYATIGNVEGEGGQDNVGGLVGLAGGNESTIVASYATGNADGGPGGNTVGGLVGANSTGSTIIASYAIGSATGGAGDRDYVGGLVGWNTENGTIVASYATGNADGGLGDDDGVGGLVGRNVTRDGGAEGTITQSYSFGTPSNGDPGSNGTDLPTIGGMDITSARQLDASDTATTADAGDSLWWNSASNTGAGAWNFGDENQNPALVYNDYDGTGSTYASCSDNNGGFPSTISGPGISTTLTCGSTLIGTRTP